MNLCRKCLEWYGSVYLKHESFFGQNQFFFQGRYSRDINVDNKS